MSAMWTGEMTATHNVVLPTILMLLVLLVTGLWTHRRNRRRNAANAAMKRWVGE
jgi:cbb3-type cytochrome oxidase subunit 3